MPHSKKQKLVDGDAAASTDDDNSTPSFERLGTDELANVFGFLRPEDIMRARLNKKMREAAKTTIVPMTEFEVDSVDKYNAMAAMTTALPNLQQISIGSMLGFGVGYGCHAFRHGEDPGAEMLLINENCYLHDMNIISNFRKLRCLDLGCTRLNGRYPFLFNFPLLHNLRIHYEYDLKLDLEILAGGLPLLKELYCHKNRSLTGNINCLRVLKDTLTKVTISICCVKGSFMDLADFPCLEELNLTRTLVTGDIREIGERDFLALETLTLPSGVYGGMGYKFQRISDAPGIISTLYSFKKQRPSLLMEDWFAMLSEDSSDWYEGVDAANDERSTAPNIIAFVQAGSRIGYRWETDRRAVCEVIWLDPEPDQESRGYVKYIEELRTIEQQVDIYRGFHQPPTEDEYNLIWEAREGCEYDYYPSDSD